MTGVKRETAPGDASVIIEVLMPLEVYWKVQEVLKSADYSVATGEDNTSVSELHRKVYGELKKYAVHEKDRVWLHERSATT